MGIVSHELGHCGVSLCYTTVPMQKHYLCISILAFALAGCGVTPLALPTAVPPLPATQPPASALAPTAASTAIPPTPTPQPAARIAVIGDYGMAGENEARVAALVNQWQPDYVITTGDNNYPAGESTTIDANIGQYYHEFIGPYTGNYGTGAAENRFFPVLGNHDLQAANGQPYYDYFTLPGNERYYTVDLGAARLFALNSMPGEADGVSADSPQGGWLQQQLADSDACWNIVAMHHPPFSSGLHGSSDWMQWPYAAWGADMVLAGHDHSYERFTRDGIPYIVNGLGGGALYALDPPIAGSEVQFAGAYGAMLLEADRTTLHVQFVTVDGTVVDDQMLTGGCGSGSQLFL